MKMFRVYYVDPDSNVKIYSCNAPGYWAHHCVSPADCVPFDSREDVEKFAETEEKYVSPRGKRFIEDYEETRPLAKNKYKGDIVPVAMLRYITCKESYVPIV